MNRPALQNKRVGVLRTAVRARKVFGTFEKQTPALYDERNWETSGGKKENDREMGSERGGEEKIYCINYSNSLLSPVVLIKFHVRTLKTVILKNKSENKSVEYLHKANSVWFFPNFL